MAQVASPVRSLPTNQHQTNSPDLGTSPTALNLGATMSQGSFLVSTGSSTGGSAANNQQQQQQQHEADDPASGGGLLMNAGGSSRGGDLPAGDEDVIHLDLTGPWGEIAVAQLLTEQARQAEDGGRSASPRFHHVNSGGGAFTHASHPSGVSGGAGGQGPLCGVMGLLQSVELMSGFDGALMVDHGDLDDSGYEFQEEGEEGEEWQGLSPTEPGGKMQRDEKFLRGFFQRFPCKM